MDTVTNAVIYARFSSHSQQEQSIDGQLRYCREYAAHQNAVGTNAYIVFVGGYIGIVCPREL